MRLGNLFPMILAAALAAACSASDRDADDDDGSSDGDTDTDDNGGCDPGEVWCLDTTWVVECNDAGAWEEIEDCSAQGLLCAAGECVDTSYACAVAINQKSYIGCEYYAVTLANGVDAANFQFAVAIANAGSETATIGITDGPGGTYNTTQVIPGNEMLVQTLPWKLPVKQPGSFGDGSWFTRKTANATYRITSDRPVTAYQFSPLHYQSGNVFSYTNDASLLLPVHVYRDEYIAISRPTLKVSEMGWDPGFLAVIGPATGSSTVQITTTAYTVASDAVSNATFQAMSPGSTFQVTVEPFEVFQLLSATETGCTGATPCSNYTCCNTPTTYDLTGTEIRVIAGRNPAVFSGTDCSFVPFNKWACDHLEQQMFPRETWGSRYVCGRNETQASGEPTIWRVVSGSDGNLIQFSSGAHPSVTLDRGEYVEFESMNDFVVEGSGRVAVAQFLVGQNYTSDYSPPPNGDPAMALVVPVEQYRTSYTFLTPDTYVRNYLTVIHGVGNYPTLDGNTLVGQGYTMDIDGEWAKTNIEIQSGIHYIESSQPFAIMVYGVGSYTSYMYPGGLDLAKVDTIVE